MEQTVKTLKPVCSLLDRCFNFVLSFLQLSPSWHLCWFLAMELSQLSYSWNVPTIGNQQLWRDSGHDLSARHIAWLPPQSWRGSYGTESQIGTKQCTLSRTHTHTHTHTHMSRLWLFNFFSAWSLKQEFQFVLVCNCSVVVRCELGIVHLCSVVTSTLTSPSRRFEIGTTPTPDITSCVRRTMLVEPRLWRCYGGTGSNCMKEFSRTSWRWTRWLKRRITISTNFLSWSLVYRFNV